jgi:hypothetical protein
MKLKYSWLLSCLFLVSCQCAPPPPAGLGEPCSSDPDCASPLVCGPDGLCAEPVEVCNNVECGGECCDAGDICLNNNTCAPDCGQNTRCGADGLTCCDAGELCLEDACVPDCGQNERCGEVGELCCGAGDICLRDECVTPGAICENNFDCAEDEVCDPTLGQCLPRDPNLICEFRPDVFPALEAIDEWHWVGLAADLRYHNVINTPVVADLDDDGAPEVISHAYRDIFLPNDPAHDTTGATGAQLADAVLVVLDGATGQEELTFTGGVDVNTNLVLGAGLLATNNPTVGQLDPSTSTLEIVSALASNELIAFRVDTSGALPALVEFWRTSGLALGNGGANGGGVSIADLDGDGTPEVVYGCKVLNASTGALIGDAGFCGGRAVGQNLSIVSDVDEDGLPDIVGGNRAVHFDPSGADPASRMTVLWTAPFNDGFPAIGDLDNNGTPEVAVISNGAANGTGDGVTYVLDGATGVPLSQFAVAPLTVPGGGHGGAPTIADFDGDGAPEWATAGRGAYVVFDLECFGSATTCTQDSDCGANEGCPTNGRCVKTGDECLVNTDCDAGIAGNTCEILTARQCAPTGCDANGVLWMVKTQDISSDTTGSSVFDFEGDGKAEAVYNDECFIRVYNGADGAELLERPSTSRTALENPIIVDVDGDNNAEIVVGSNDDQALFRDLCGFRTQGITAFGDANDQWVRTRPIWNQHTYHVTNVELDGSAPVSEERNWEVEGFNNFRQNVQGGGIFDAPDLTVLGVEIIDLCPNITLRAQVANVGALGVPAGVVVTFFIDAIDDNNLLGEAIITEPLFPGSVEEVELTFDLSLFVANVETPHTYFAVVDRDAAGVSQHNECVEDNNDNESLELTCDIID